MPDDATPDLSFLAAQLRRVIEDGASTRDDLRVLTAIALRQDNTLAALLTEVRAMPAQHNRMESRLRTLEARVP